MHHIYSRMMHKYESKIQPKKTVSLVGARGYTGLELARLLLRHPGVELTHAYASQPFKLTDDLLETKAAGVTCLTESVLDQDPSEIVFLATPAEVSLRWAPKLVAAGKKVVDLSGAFRLKTNDYKKWYGFEHDQNESLMKADYGLCPVAGAVPATTKLIANPGCYATAVSLALIPLVKEGLIDTEHIVIDAKSGTTGGGRKATEGLLFSEVDGECLPYKVGKHQHTPEIQEAVQAFGGAAIDPHFTTHLLPVKRGIVASVYATATTTDIGAIADAFQKHYGEDKLIKHGRKIDQLAALKNVVHTPFTHISYEMAGRKLFVFSAIDNLMKGAASQAIENLNRLMDAPAATGLTMEG